MVWDANKWFGFDRSPATNAFDTDVKVVFEVHIVSIPNRSSFQARELLRPLK